MNAPRIYRPLAIALLAIVCLGMMNACTDDSTGIDPNSPSEFYFLEDTIYTDAYNPVELTAIVTGYAATLINTVDYGDNSPSVFVPLKSDTVRLSRTYNTGGEYHVLLRAGDKNGFADSVIVIVAGVYRPTNVTTVVIRIDGAEFNFYNLKTFNALPDTSFTETDSAFAKTYINYFGDGSTAKSFTWEPSNDIIVGTNWSPPGETEYHLSGTIQLNREGTMLDKADLQLYSVDTSGEERSIERMKMVVVNLPLSADSSETATYAKYEIAVPASSLGTYVKELVNIREFYRDSDPIYEKRDYLNYVQTGPATITVELKQ